MPRRCGGPDLDDDGNVVMIFGLLKGSWRCRCRAIEDAGRRGEAGGGGRERTPILPTASSGISKKKGRGKEGRETKQVKGRQEARTVWSRDRGGARSPRKEMTTLDRAARHDVLKNGSLWSKLPLACFLVEEQPSKARVLLCLRGEPSEVKSLSEPSLLCCCSSCR